MVPREAGTTSWSKTSIDTVVAALRDGRLISPWGPESWDVLLCAISPCYETLNHNDTKILNKQQTKTRILFTKNSQICQEIKMLRLDFSYLYNIVIRTLGYKLLRFRNKQLQKNMNNQNGAQAKQKNTESRFHGNSIEIVRKTKWPRNQQRR